MRPLLRTLLVAAVVALPSAAAAQTLTTRDLLALSQAGLSDEVLLALIDADRSVFQLGPYEVLELRKQGLSDAVLVKMIGTARPQREAVADARARAMQPPAPAPETAPESRPVERVIERVIERVEQPPVVVTQTVTQQVRVEPPPPQYVQVPVYIPVATRPVREKEPEPVYWGWGGKRRPDAWQEPPKSNTKDPKKPGGGSDR